MLIGRSRIALSDFRRTAASPPARRAATTMSAPRHTWRAIGTVAFIGAIGAFAAGKSALGVILLTGAFIAFVVGAYV